MKENIKMSNLKIKLADRAAATNISGIRKVFDLAAKLESPVNLSIGQPHFDVPEEVKQASIAGIQEGANSYTPTQGRADLIEGISKTFNNKYGQGEIIVTSAVSGGLNLAFLALLNPGDEILIPDPYFVMYKQLALMLGAKPVYYDTYPEFKLPVEKIESLITEKTRAIVFGSPSNPTGISYSGESLKEITTILRKRGIIAISDEIYDIFSYDHPTVSISDFYLEGTIVLKGFSKSHAMTGWRLGYAAGPKEIIQTMAKFQQFTFVCAPSIAQAAGLKALDTDMTKFVIEYKQKRDMIYNGLTDIGYDVVKPDGAFYIFPKAPWGTGEEFVAKCIENNLLVIPGNVFSEKNTHFRISYAAEDKTIKAGLEILQRLFKEN